MGSQEHKISGARRKHTNQREGGSMKDAALKGKRTIILLQMWHKLSHCYLFYPMTSKCKVQWASFRVGIESA